MPDWARERRNQQWKTTTLTACLSPCSCDADIRRPGTGTYTYTHTHTHTHTHTYLSTQRCILLTQWQPWRPANDHLPTPNKGNSWANLPFNQKPNTDGPACVFQAKHAKLAASCKKSEGYGVCHFYAMGHTHTHTFTQFDFYTPPPLSPPLLAFTG